jgi:hypothetical protein
MIIWKIDGEKNKQAGILGDTEGTSINGSRIR